MRFHFSKDLDPTRRALKGVGADMSLYAINQALGEPLKQIRELNLVERELRAGNIAAADFVTKTVITLEPQVRNVVDTSDFIHVRLIQPEQSEAEVS